MIRRYTTALRPHLLKRLEEIREADIVVGIPCFNSEDTIVHVIQMVSHGIDRHFRERRAVIMVADGGSTDDTRDRAVEFQLKPWQEKIVTIYRGVGGKGSALRAFFETAYRLNASACACVDADLRSIDPDWIKYLIEPVLDRGFEFVAPVYSRYKYDATITNNIVYNLVRALYGKRIRQPIGGDFAFARRLAGHFLDQDVWSTDIARFGIDIWMTLNAIVENASICQANLGVKTHEGRDPVEAIAPVFHQVCGTFFSLLEEHESFWRATSRSEPVPTFGLEVVPEPEPIEVDQPHLVREFQEAVRLFGSVYRQIFSYEVNFELQRAATAEPHELELPVATWVRLVYELAAAYHHMRIHRMKLLSLMTPLYLGRVASFITQTRDMTSREAEQVVEEQAQLFEEHRPYLHELWDEHPAARQVDEALAGADSGPASPPLRI